MHFQIKLISVTEFDGLCAEWNELLSRSACDSVFLRWEWIHTWWGIFQRKKRLVILTARREGLLCGVAPFYIDQVGLLRLRTLKFCSDELSPDYMDIIAEKGQEVDVVRDIVNDIFQRRSQWDLIALDNLRAESALLSHPSLFQGYVSTFQVSNRCPYIKIDRAFDDYCSDRSELRSFSLKKKLKHLLEEKKVKHEIASDKESLSRGLRDLFLLHEKRAKNKKIRSNFLSADVRQFHQELSRYFFNEKILSLHLLCDGQVPISAIYGFIYKNKYFYFQTGFDPAYAKWSAGAVLLYFCIRRAFEDNLREFDLLKGAEGYKSIWSDTLRDEMLFTVYNSNWRGSLWRVAKSFEAILRRIKHSFVGIMTKMPTQTQ